MSAPKQPYGSVPYADEGLQSDKKKRYPIDTADHVRAAWAYINHPTNAAKYKPKDREQIKARILVAAKKFGITVETAVEEPLYRRMQRRYGAGPNSVYLKDKVRKVVVEEETQRPVSSDVPVTEDLAVEESVVPGSVEIVSVPSLLTWSTSTNAASPVVTERTPPITKAFLTEANGRTLLTAPAGITKTAMTPNEHFQWLGGRLVGAEKPNRNGALWTTADLEMGQVTVAHGPVNWLHESRHVIGAIAQAQLVNTQTADGEPDQPYIETAAAVWKWLYPDEAMVIQQASDMGKLWFSMECVSKSVECVGENGCGASVSYGDYVANKACVHLVERSSVRRFADPTFLGAAILTPPVRPGWAEADVRVLRQAANLGESTFEAAGRPDMTTSEWEQLMASVLRYAEVSDAL